VDRLLGAAAPAGIAPTGLDPASGVRGVLAWLGVLAVAVIIGWLLVVFIRRRLGRDTEDQLPFTLESLRELRRSGRITEAEFDRAKAAMIDATRRAIARSASEKGNSGKAPADGGRTAHGDQHR